MALCYWARTIYALRYQVIRVHSATLYILAQAMLCRELKHASLSGDRWSHQNSEVLDTLLVSGSYYHTTGKLSDRLAAVSKCLHDVLEALC